MLATMPDSSWTVRVGKWTWIYDFSKKGTVGWRDPFNGKSGTGTWRIEGGKIVIHWAASKQVDKWNIPINPKNATGRCDTVEGAFDIKAEMKAIPEVKVDICSLTPASKARFVESCSAAVGKLQAAELSFRGWLFELAIAYGKAFEEHKNFEDRIAATKKLADDMIFGAALAFLGGGVGGVIGGVMKQLKYGDFMVDAVKDVGKFAVRGPGGAFLGHLAAKSEMPTSPLEWQNAMALRLANEMAYVSRFIDNWRMAVRGDDPSFNACFDPLTAVDERLVFSPQGGAELHYTKLPKFDRAALQTDFQRGWLSAWIHLNRPSSGSITTDQIRTTVTAYASRVGNETIKQQLSEWPVVELPSGLQYQNREW